MKKVSMGVILSDSKGPGILFFDQGVKSRPARDDIAGVGWSFSHAVIPAKLVLAKAGAGTHEFSHRLAKPSPVSLV